MLHTIKMEFSPSVQIMSSLDISTPYQDGFTCP